MVLKSISEFGPEARLQEHGDARCFLMGEVPQGPGQVIDILDSTQPICIAHHEQADSQRHYDSIPDINVSFTQRAYSATPSSTDTLGLYPKPRSAVMSACHCDGSPLLGSWENRISADTLSADTSHLAKSPMLVDSPLATL